MFIAVAAERTKHIRLGTGVSSLPYHHPLMLADRIVLLDHLTRGRVMLGVGPGALPSDAFMMGIPVAEQRDRMEEALEAILLLLRSDEPVTMKTDWFTLDDARLNLRPYTHPHFEVAVASQISPAGSRAAGRFGTGLLSIGATNQQGFDLLGYHWQIAEERAAQFGTSVDRRNWRLVGPVHIAETREQAYADVQFGLADWVDYFQRVAALPIAPDTSNADEMADAINESGFAVIGTPDDADRADPAAVGPVRRRLRDVPRHGARLGRHCADAQELRAAGPLRVPRVPRLGRVDDVARATGRRRTVRRSSARSAPRS